MGIILPNKKPAEAGSSTPIEVALNNLASAAMRGGHHGFWQATHSQQALEGKQFELPQDFPSAVQYQSLCVCTKYSFARLQIYARRVPQRSLRRMAPS